MVPSMSSEDGPAAVFAEDMAVTVKFPRTKEEERGDRAAWPWLPGTIVQQCGPDEWQVCRRGHGRGRAQGRQPAHPPHAGEQAVLPAGFRDASEIKLRDAR